MSKTWGTPTWKFFHSLAEHVDAEFYKHNRTIFKQFITGICSVLPCMECSKHSIKYIKYNLTDGKISTKEDLKRFFLNFHNDVNKRKGKPIFTDIEIYKRSSLYDSYMNFKREYTSNKISSRGFCDTLQRRNIIISFEKFLNSNKASFKWFV